MAAGDRAGRGGARIDRAQSQCRLRHRPATARSSVAAPPQPGGRPHAEAVALAEAGEAAQRRHPLHQPRALRPRQRARPDLRVADRRCRHRARGRRARGSRSAHRGPGHRRCFATPESRSTSAKARRRRPPLDGRLSHPPRARPPADHAQAGAQSIDGKIALPSGESKWITGEDARAHVHLERAHSDMILVGRGTYLADQPGLDVRLPGLEERSPAPRLADPRRRGRRLGNPVFSAGCVPTS